MLFVFICSNLNSKLIFAKLFSFVKMKSHNGYLQMKEKLQPEMKEKKFGKE